MILFLTPDTVSNRRALQLRKVGERRLGRGFQVVPRGSVGSRAFWRVLLDQGFPRYMLALAPFPIAMLLRPDLALAISQAPLLMFAIVYYVESHVLSVPTPSKRRELIDPDEAAHRKERFTHRGRQALGEIAAGRGLQDTVLHLVVEQSALARVPELTLISVQLPAPPNGGRPTMLPLDAEERSAIASRLFDDSFTEADLHLVNLAENDFLRVVSLEAAEVSAHDRLMAMAAGRG